jgi:DNA 3'-phosphatase
MNEPNPKRPKTTSQSSLSSFFTIKTTVQKETQTKDKDVSSSQKIDTSSNEPIIPRSVPASLKATWNVYQNACIYRKVRGEVNERTKLAAFDLDGTLLTWRIDGWPSKFEHYELWNATVIDRLRRLYDEEDYRLVVFSNQGLIRQAFTGVKATFVKSLLEWFANLLDRPLSVVLSTSKKNGFHKPSHKMWNVAEECCFGGRTMDVSSSFFVGDSIGGDDDPQGGVDVGFARAVGEHRNANLRFYSPTEFFGPSSKQKRDKGKVAVTYEKPPAAVLQTRAALVSGYLEGPIMLILCGAQGSGKSTFCDKLLEKNDAWVHLSQDTINNGKPGKREMVEMAAEKALREGRCVVVDRMHLDEAQRSVFVDLAKQVDVPVHALVLSTSTSILASRVKLRSNHPAGVEGEKGVKVAIISASKMVLPTYAEGFALISVTATEQGVARFVDQYSKILSAEPNTTSILKQFDLPQISIPSVILGTMKMGKKSAADIVSKARSLGFAGVDTAPTYNNEIEVGQGMDNGMFCVVKVPKRASTAEDVQKELCTSLSSLGRKQADLLLLHWPSDSDTLKSVWQGMETCVQEGLVKALGVCNFSAKALAGLIPMCSITPCINQVERHPFLPQWDLVDFCAQNDILLQAHTPLGQGNSDLWEEPSVQQVVASTGLSPAKVLLLWNLQQGVAVVPRCSSEEHSADVMELFTTAASSEALLVADDLMGLNGISRTCRFVAPPFMFGSASYCWATKANK